MKKRRRSGSSSDSDDEIDPEIQRQLELRLAAHCEKAIGKIKPRKQKKLVPGGKAEQAVEPQPVGSNRAAKKAARKAANGTEGAVSGPDDAPKTFLEDVLGAYAPAATVARPQPVEVEPARRPVMRVDAQLRKNYMSSKISKVRNWDAVQKQQERQYSKPLEETFKSVAQEVQQLGATQFIGRDKRTFEANRLAALGAKIAKSPKMPIRMMEKMTKSMAKRNEKLRTQCNQTGQMYEPQTMLGMMRGTQAEVRMKQRREDARKRDAGLKTGLGSYKNGTLTLRKSDITGIKATFHKDVSEDFGSKGKGGGKGGKGKGGKGKGGKGRGKDGGKGKRR